MNFTDEQKSKIQEWLSGKGNYRTLVYAFYTGNISTTDYFQGVEVYGARFKISGLDTDIRYRVPTLRCTFKDFPLHSAESGSPTLLENSRVYRFYLSVDLEDLNLPEEDRVPGHIKLLRSCWFSIRSYKIITNTALNRNVGDVQIEAVPRIYEYNKRFRWGPKAYPDNHAIAMRMKGAISWASHLVDLETTYKGVVTAPRVPDSPKIIQGSGSSETVFDPQSYPLYIAVSGDYTLLSLLSKYFVTQGYAIRPEQYSISPPQDSDTPTVTFDDVTSIFQDSNIRGQKYIESLNQFDFVEPQETSFVENVYTSYEISMYSIDFNTTQDVQIFVSYGSDMRGWVDSSNLDFGVGNKEVTISDIRRLTYAGDSGGAAYYGMEINRNGFSYYISPEGSMVNYGLRLEGFAYELYKETRLFNSPSNSAKTIRLDSSWSSTYWSLSGRSLYDVYAQYATKKVSFKAEWRPWINIYDVVKVAYQDELGYPYTSDALVIGVDADVDGMTARYTVLVLPEV